MPEVAWYKKTEGRSVWPDHPKWSHLCLVSWWEAAAAVMGKLLLVAFCLVALAASMSSLTKEEEQEEESYLVEGGLARQARDAEPKKNRGRTKKQRRMTRKKKSKVNKARGGSSSSGRSSSCRLTSTCLSKAHDAMKLIKMVTNFKKQHKAAHAKSSQGTKKKGKTMDYHRSLLRLKEAAGGDMSAPVCNGNTTNDGAKAMGDLYAILSNCSANIEHVCHEDKFETHFNKTQADICKNATDLYEDITKECTGKAGAEACSCWDNHEGQTNSTVMIIKSDECKIKDASDNVKSALSLCKKAVGDCKKAAENVTSVIHDCENPTVSVVDLTAQAAAANATKEAAAAAIAAATETKAQAEAASTGLDSINTANFVPSSARGVRSVSTCDEVKTALVNIALALDASNTSTYNVSNALVIVNILVVTTSSSLDPACTSDDVADLDAKKTSASTLATQVVVTQEALIVEETAKYNAAVELLVEINTALAEQGESTVDPGTLAPTVTVVAMTTGAPMMTSAGTGATDSSDPSGESPVPMESSMAGSGSVPMESTPMGSPSMASNPMGSTMGSGMTGDMGSTMDFTMGSGMTGLSGMTGDMGSTMDFTMGYGMTGMSGMTQDMSSAPTGSTGMGSTPTGPTPTGPTATGPTGTGPTATAFGSTMTGSIATGSTVAMSTAAFTATT